MKSQVDRDRSVEAPGAGALRVVFAEDNLLVREGVVGLLSACEGVEVVAVAESVAGLLDAVDVVGPDVVLTDIRLGRDGETGVLVAQRLRASHPDLGVVVLSAFVEPCYAVDLLGGGTRGRGYIVKDHVADTSYLVGALRTVAAGGSFLDDAVVDALVRSRARADHQGLEALTDREREVLAEIAAGRSNAAVAAELCVSEHAVVKHMNSILSKLGLTEDPGMNRRVKAVLLYLTGQQATEEPRPVAG